MLDRQLAKLMDQDVAAAQHSLLHDGIANLPAAESMP